MAVIRKSVPGSVLKSCKVYTLDGAFPEPSHVYMTGGAHTPTGEVLSHTAIAAYQYDSRYDPPVLLYEGVTFTDALGRYALAMPYAKDTYYELKAYGQ